MDPFDVLRGERILVTGAYGSVGQALMAKLEGVVADVWPTDIDTYDVRTPFPAFGEIYNPSVVFHLAAAKHAPQGELDPLGVAQTNVIGTAAVIASFPSAKIVLTSTCKAADPETAYGASKLIAERMVLNASGTVARLYNVIEACGNVFEIWRELPHDEPIPVTECSRYFIHMDQAVDLVLKCAVLPSGRYTINPGEQRWMPDVAAEYYPDRPTVFISPRRGDRESEPLLADSEFALARDDELIQIVSPHDVVPACVS